jgi:hypothetical protein
MRQLSFQWREDKKDFVLPCAVHNDLNENLCFMLWVWWTLGCVDWKVCLGSVEGGARGFLVRGRGDSTASRTFSPQALLSLGKSGRWGQGVFGVWRRWRHCRPHFSPLGPTLLSMAENVLLCAIISYAIKAIWKIKYRNLELSCLLH